MHFMQQQPCNVSFLYIPSIHVPVVHSKVVVDMHQQITNCQQIKNYCMSYCLLHNVRKYKHYFYCLVKNLVPKSLVEKT